MRQRLAVVGQVPAHGGGQVARLGLQPLRPTRAARRAAAAGRPARPAPGSSRRGGARLRRRRAGPPAARRRTRGWSPASAPAGRARVLSSWTRLCRASASVSSSARSSSSPATSAAAWMVQPPAKTAMVSSRDRSASSSRPTLHSTVARRVRCRSGRSAVPVPSASSDLDSRSSSAPGSSSRVRAAASSMASGRPSRRRQIATTAAALPSVRAKPGRTARARSTNSATAGDAISSCSGTPAGPAGRGGQRQRRDRVLPLGPQPQHRAAGGHDDHAGAAGQQLVQVAGGAGDLLQVVQDEQPGAVAQLLGQGLQRRARPGQVGAHRPADAAHHQLRLGDPGQRDEHGPRNRSGQPARSPTASASRVLPTPPGPVSVTNRTPGRASRPASSPMACSRPTSEVVPTGSGRGPRSAPVRIGGKSAGRSAWVSW